MDVDELSIRLNNLEQARANDLQQAAQQAFMNKYGSRVSNDEGLGLVILNELNRRGIDTSAADEAVQQILDQLRMECTMLMDKIKDVQEEASELLDKTDEISDAVQTAAAATGADVSLPSEEMEANLNMPEGEMPPPPEGEMPPPPEGEMPPPPEGEMPPPPEGEMPPPPEGEMPPPPEGEMPEGDMVSDRRLKRIKRIVSDRRQKVVKKPVSYFTPSSDIVSICRGNC